MLNDDQLVSEVRETILNILASAALKDDIILVLHQDRREHILMNYANGFDKLPLLEQLALTLFVCIIIIIIIYEPGEINILISTEKIRTSCNFAYLQLNGIIIMNNV